MNEKIKILESKIAEIKGILKDASLKLFTQDGHITLLDKVSAMQNLWSEQEKLEDELNELLVENGVEINTWDW
tara:strand:- start:1264 stop:1482 length:219 start_codon:yes stop_codon:yes gene_type:complete